MLSRQTQMTVIGVDISSLCRMLLVSCCHRIRTLSNAEFGSVVLLLGIMSKLD